MTEIRTPRLHLRRLEESDLEDLAVIYADPQVMQYRVPSHPLSKLETQQKLQQLIDHWRNHHFGRWAIVEKSTQQFIGHAGLEVDPLLNEIEINYLLARSQWNKGLATEAARAISTFGFIELNCDRIIALAKPENLTSRRVMEKIRMRYEKEVELYGNSWVYYSLNRDQWKAFNKESVS